MFISVLIYFSALFGFTRARCPLGAIQGLDLSQCYLYRTEPSSWYDAEETCVQLNGHLASVSNAFVNSFISRSWYHAPEDYWLGVTTGTARQRGGRGRMAHAFPSATGLKALVFSFKIISVAYQSCEFQ